MISFVQLDDNTFIREYGATGYITNQRSTRGLVFDEVGLAFLKTIGRKPVFIHNAIDQLLPQFAGVDRPTIEADYRDFVTNLANDGFVRTGNCEKVLALHDSSGGSSFQGSLTNPLALYRDLGRHAAQQQFKDLFRQNPVLFEFQINITSRCNEQCVHCYIPHEVKTQDIQGGLFRNALDQLAEMGTLSLTISGGECMLHNDFSDFVRYAREKDFSISILSNATLLTEEFISLLKTANICKLQTSVYSLKAEDHDAITKRPGSLKTTLANLERLISAGVPLDINCPVLTTNYGSVSDVLVWARERDVPAGPTLAIMGQSNCETKNLGHRATAEQIAEVIKDLKDLGYLDVAITDKSTATYHENETCGVGWDKLCMEHDGNIYPCPGWGRYCLGNIENETIFSIWNNSEKLSALRRITYDSFPKCKGCNLRQYCTVCLVRNANENNGDMFQLCPHVCDVALLLKNAFDEKSMSVK